MKKLQQYLQGKSPDPALCEDAIFQNDYFVAVIDGVTAKGRRLYKGMTSGAYAADVLCRELVHMKADAAAAEVILALNEALRSAACEDAPPEDRPQANLVIFSRDKSEIWLFGDCQFMAGGDAFSFPKEVDLLLASLRAFIAQDLIRQGMSPDAASSESRERIMPYLKAQSGFANSAGPYGYDVLDGGNINTDHIRIVPVRSGDLVVLASDGYPKLFETLEESERYLREMLERDPYCINENRQTKGLSDGNLSYDDRAYISFRV